MAILRSVISIFSNSSYTLQFYDLVFRLIFLAWSGRDKLCFEKGEFTG